MTSFTILLFAFLLFPNSKSTPDTTTASAGLCDQALPAASEIDRAIGSLGADLSAADSCKCYCGGTSWSPGATACMGGFKQRCVDRNNDGKNCGWDTVTQGSEAVRCDGGEHCRSGNLGSASVQPTSIAAPADPGPGMIITFQSCGYRAFGLNVACENIRSGQRSAKILQTGDTSTTACVTRLYEACSAVGYRAQQEGNSLRIFGTGIKVTAVGPVFTSRDF